MSLIHVQYYMACFILLISLVSGYLPFKRFSTETVDFPYSEAFACGVFLGAGLIHMLGDANEAFIIAGVDYPMAFLICGLMFLLLLLLEHIGTELTQHRTSNNSIVILSVLMLSVHSLLEGAALGISQDYAGTSILFFAIIAHKWAASFALSLQINKSSLVFSSRLLLFVFFALMTPVGTLFGLFVQHHANSNYLIGVFNALAAGTFLYIGTLHGLNRAIMIRSCCNLKEFMLVIIGFTLMAVVAIWA